MRPDSQQTINSDPKLTGNEIPICVHCGEDCLDNSIVTDNRNFCCIGCKTVYGLLKDSGLCAYYELSDNPGTSSDYDAARQKYAFLDNTEIADSLIEYSDQDRTVVTLSIPNVHCVSCIWLLENLYKLDSAILYSRLNFVSRELSVTYAASETTLRKVVELLASIGYPPSIDIEKSAAESERAVNQTLYMQIGVAGFAFANIMLLSFPEYLSILGFQSESNLNRLFPKISLLLSLPVVLYSAVPFLKSAVSGLKHRMMNIDFPLSLGIVALFIRSVYEVVSGNGAGYFDSLSGLVFLLLLGRLFQHKTYARLSFDRTYRSYFPVAVTRIIDEREEVIPITDLKAGDRILVRNGDLIPADSVIMKGAGSLDYAFVTGESQPVDKEAGDVVYAGGIQNGEALNLEVVEDASRSYLTRLWDHDKMNDAVAGTVTSLADRVSKYFVIAVVTIALASFLYWLRVDTGSAFNVLAAVLIVACPCALALASPFTLGTAVRILGFNRLFLKNTKIVEAMSGLSSIVFDKTGTLTNPGSGRVEYIGTVLSNLQKSIIRSAVRQSKHPIAHKIAKTLNDFPVLDLLKYTELPGKGIVAEYGDYIVRIGSSDWLEIENDDSISVDDTANQTFVEINAKVVGKFRFTTEYMPGIKSFLKRLRQCGKLALLSGDTDRDAARLKKLFPVNSHINFNKSPYEKLEYIEDIRSAGDSVLMLGDGLNDAGALKTANVGFAVSSNESSFSPASDGIISYEALLNLDKFILFSKKSLKIIIFSFIISFLYNLIGMAFAVTGKLTPLVSAILMPLSSITVVSFAVMMTTLQAKLLGLRTNAGNSSYYR